VRGDDIGGIAVHIGARVSALAGPNDVLVSSTLRDLVIGSGLEFEDRGAHELKGVPGEWHLSAVASRLSRRRAGQSPAASGRRTSNRAPVPRLSADSVPRCAWTRPAAIARPRPDPLGSDESARGTRLFEPR
jgi:hypothetical protein